MTGLAAESPLLFLLFTEPFDSAEGAESVLPSEELPKQWPKDEQGSPCMLAECEIITRDKKVSLTFTDMRWIQETLDFETQLIIRE